MEALKVEPENSSVSAAILEKTTPSRPRPTASTKIIRLIA